MTVRYQEDEQIWKTDKSELHRQVQDLYIQLERIKRETQNQISQFKSKYTDYKMKVKQANHQIQVLTARLAQTELAADSNMKMGPGSNELASGDEIQ